MEIEKVQLPTAGHVLSDLTDKKKYRINSNAQEKDTIDVEEGSGLAFHMEIEEKHNLIV